LTERHVIFVPGKNPKPDPELHRALLWRALVEGVRRAAPGVPDKLGPQANNFKLIAWNFLYYRRTKDESPDLPWIDALVHKHGPAARDIKEANSWFLRLDRLLYTVADIVPAAISLLPRPLRMTAEETKRYFENRDGIADEIRELLKQALRPLFAADARILLIGHSLGSVIAYDTLWELSHVEKLRGKIDQFLTLGSPLGMSYVQRRLMGFSEHGSRRYPTNIRRWVNVSAVGDLTALDAAVGDDFREMRRLGLVESIKDYGEGIYNFFRDDKGLNCHRSYGYLVNAMVGKIIADWWHRT
jgi:hypothetical protein